MNNWQQAIVLISTIVVSSLSIAQQDSVRGSQITLGQSYHTATTFGLTGNPATSLSQQTSWFHADSDTVTTDTWRYAGNITNYGLGYEVPDIVKANDKLDDIIENIEGSKSLSRAQVVVKAANDAYTEFKNEHINLYVDGVLSQGLSNVGLPVLSSAMVYLPLLRGTVGLQWDSVSSVDLSFSGYGKFDTSPLKSDSDCYRHAKSQACLAQIQALDLATRHEYFGASCNTGKEPSCHLTVTVDSSNYQVIRAGTLSQLALSYGRFIHYFDHKSQWLAGNVFVGGRIKLYTADVLVVKHQLTSENATDNDDRIENDLKDAVSKKSTRASLDLGVQMQTTTSVYGLVIEDLLIPKFAYTDGSTVTLKPKLIASGTVFFNDSKSLHANLQWDLNSGRNIANNQTQWTVVGLGYTPDSYLIPAIRIGKRWQNAGDNALSYNAFGFTLFKTVNFDAAISNKSTGDSPQGILFNLGFYLDI